MSEPRKKKNHKKIVAERNTLIKKAVRELGRERILMLYSGLSLGDVIDTCEVCTGWEQTAVKLGVTTAHLWKVLKKNKLTGLIRTRPEYSDFLEVRTA